MVIYNLSYQKSEILAEFFHQVFSERNSVMHVVLGCKVDVDVGNLHRHKIERKRGKI
jgi:hypothetical protein